MKSAESVLAVILFIPVIAGLWLQVWEAATLLQRLMALTLLLLAPEQAYMARVDLQNIALIQRVRPDSRLKPFRRLVWGTILGQLLGFYLAAMGWFGLGLLVLLAALIRFNVLAEIRLEPQGETLIIPSRIRDRWMVLALNGLAAVLGLMWLLNWGQLYVASGLLILVAGYGLIKLTMYGRGWLQSRYPSLTHTAGTVDEHPQSGQ